MRQVGSLFVVGGRELLEARPRRELGITEVVADLREEGVLRQQGRERGAAVVVNELSLEGEGARPERVSAASKPRKPSRAYTSG